VLKTISQLILDGKEFEKILPGSLRNSHTFSNIFVEYRLAVNMLDEKGGDKNISIVCYHLELIDPFIHFIIHFSAPFSSARGQKVPPAGGGKSPK
jgi:hypothetical protein